MSALAGEVDPAHLLCAYAFNTGIVAFGVLFWFVGSQVVSRFDLFNRSLISNTICATSDSAIPMAPTTSASIS
jgi:hypothetical protein